MDKDKKSIILLIGLLLTCLFIRIGLDVCSCQDYWFNNWTFRKTITFDSDYAEGNKLNFNVTFLELNGKCQSDFDDLRLTDLNGILLDVWNQTESESNYINLWLNSTGDSDYLLYYGNPNCDDYWCEPENIFTIYDNVSLALPMNQESVNPTYIIYDDDETKFITSGYIFEETTIQQSGSSCLGFYATSGSYVAVTWQQENNNFSLGDSFSFWFYGNNSGELCQITFVTYTFNFWIYQFTDIYSGWHLISKAKSDYSSVTGSPSWNNIDEIQIYIEKINVTYYLDRLIITESKVYDFSGNHNNMANYGAVPINTGRFGNGFYFDGTNSYIRNDSTNEINLGSGFTIIVYCNFDLATANDYLFGGYFKAGGYYLSRVYTTDNFFSRINNGTNTEDMVSNNLTITENNEYIYGFGFKDNTIEYHILNDTMYVDSSVNCTIGEFNDLWIGHRFADKFNGTMSGFYIINEYLEFSDIQLFNQYYPDSQIETGKIFLRNWVIEMPIPEFSVEYSLDFDVTEVFASLGFIFGMMALLLIIVKDRRGKR